MKTMMKTAMKMVRGRGAWAAAVTLLCGVAISSALRPSATTGTQLPQPARPSAEPCPPVAAAPEAEAADELWWGESPEGEEWKHRHNGTRLRLDYARLGAQELADAKVEALPAGGVLVAAGDTLYLLDPAGRVVWRHEEPQTIFDFAHVEGPGLVYVTAGDNNMFILETRSGWELHRESRNGRAGFGAAVAFGKDLCLVTDAYSGYREPGNPGPPMSDGVSAWRGTKMLWRRKLPPDAELRIGGNRIFAVTKTRSQVLVAEITPAAAGR